MHSYTDLYINSINQIICLIDLQLSFMFQTQTRVIGRNKIDNNRIIILVKTGEENR